MKSPTRARSLTVNIESGLQMREYEHIADRIAGGFSGRLLDWGCGWGQVTSLLRERGVDTEAYTYDPHVSGPGVITLDAFPDVHAHVHNDPVELPFPDHHFDVVLSCGVLEHVGSPERSLDEIHRVLRPHGRFLVYKLPNRFSYLEAVAKRVGWYYHGSLPDDRVYDRRSAVGLLERHSFRVDEFRRTNLLPLTLTHPRVHAWREQLWSVNRALGRVPGLDLLATNLELDATAL